MCEQREAPLGCAPEQGVEEQWRQPRWEKGGLNACRQNAGDVLQKGDTVGCRRAFKVEWSPFMKGLECLAKVPSIFSTALGNQKRKKKRQ